jgi:transglutaminase-like putative cysteine protease/tetratricopeptide (TPR) repeat protein
VTGLLLAAVAEPSAAYRAGEIAGALLVPLALLLGIAKCAAVARRRTTSAWCAYSLLLALTAWLVGSVGTIAKTVGAAGTWVAVVEMLGLVVCLFLALAAVITAILGLTLYGRHPEYVQGRRQAVAAILIGGLVLMLAGAGAVVGITRALRARAAPPSVNWTAPGQVQRFEELNFTYETPPAPFVSWDTKVNDAMTVGFLRTKPTVFFMIIAERSADDLTTDSSGLASIAQANMASSSTSTPVFGETKPHVVNGLSGVRFSADVVVNGRNLAYSYWIYASNGFLYQLITFGEKAERSRVDEDAELLVGRFRRIDPQRRAVAEPTRPFTEFRSAAYPYVLDLTGTEWNTWPNATESNVDAEVGALRGDTAGLLVTPFPLTGEAPHPDALTQALLKEWDIAFPSAEVSTPQPVQKHGLSGYDIGFERTVDDKVYEYRLRILADAQWGLETAVWVLKGSGDVDALAAAVFAGLRMEGARPPEASAPGTPRVRAHAGLYNRIGLFYHGAQDHAASRRFFEAAIRLDPQERTYLVNLLRACSEAGERKAALAYIDGAAAHKTHEDVRSWQAWILKEDGQKAAALAAYEGLFKGRAYRNDEDFLAYMNLLAGAGRWTDVTRLFDGYAVKENTLKLRLEHSRLLADAERHEEAVRMLEAVQKTMPYSTDVAFALIRHHQGLEQHRKVLEICDDLVQRGFDSATVRYMKGDAQVGLKWYRAAKASFEQALKKEPKDKETLEYLKYVSGLLGEGNNSSIKDAIAAVALPPELTARVAGAAGKADAAGYGAYYVFIVDGFRFEKGRARVRTTRQRVKVVDSSGVERFSTLAVGFDPLSERVFVNELIVRDAAGAIVSRGEAKDYYVTDDKDSDLATHRQTLYLPVPSLDTGHTVDFTYTRRQLGAPEAFSYESFILSAARPTRVRAVFYLGEPALIRHRASPTVKHERIQGGLLWSLEDVPVYPWEPRQAPVSRFAPTLRVAAAGDEWSALAQSYWSELARKLAPEASVKALAQRLTQGRTGREEKIHALLRHTYDGYVYKPIEFGRRARIPNTAGETVRKKYGDCKDHSVLLRQLLEAIGVPAQLALVNTDDPVDEDLPSLDQFDHMIVFVPDERGGGVFYDGTDKSLDVRVHPPLGLSERRALVLDPERPRFESIPGYAPDSSRVRVDRRARLTAEGRLGVSESVEFTGYYASALRSHLKSLEVAKREQWAQGTLAGWISGLELRSFAAREVNDAEKPLALDVEYALPLACAPDAAGWRCTPPLTWERHYLEVEPSTSRLTPFAIEYPLQFTSRTTFEIPPGWALESRPPHTRGGTEPRRADDVFAAWSTAITTSAGMVTVSFDAAMKRGEFAADRYRAFRHLLDEGLRSASQPVRAEPPRSTTRP